MEENVSRWEALKAASRTAAAAGQRTGTVARLGMNSVAKGVKGGVKASSPVVASAAKTTGKAVASGARIAAPKIASGARTAGRGTIAAGRKATPYAKGAVRYAWENPDRIADASTAVAKVAGTITVAAAPTAVGTPVAVAAGLVTATAGTVASVSRFISKSKSGGKKKP
jgi:hypothetical protein